MATHNAKDRFYAELDRKIEGKEIKSEEFSTFILSHAGENLEESTSGFYELCSKFCDISLNAPKYVDSKTCDVQASFQLADIKKAKVALNSYLNEHGLRDIEGILNAIGLMYRFAVAWDDSRAKSTVVQPEGYYRNASFFGKYYDFCVLPDDIWGQIKTEILNEAQKRRKNVDLASEIIIQG